MKLAFHVTPAIASVELTTVVKQMLDIAVAPSTAKGYMQGLAAIAARRWDAQNPGVFLRHLSYSVVAAMPEHASTVVRQSTCLACIVASQDGESLLIFSGTLEDYRTEIINGCSLSSHKLFREFTTSLLILFDKEGLGFVFESFTRKVHESTLLLEER